MLSSVVKELSSRAVPELKQLLEGYMQYYMVIIFAQFASVKRFFFSLPLLLVGGQTLFFCTEQKFSICCCKSL